jgi:TolB-like protein
MSGKSSLSGETSKVFISHSIKDKAVADRICVSLEKNRIPCWIAPRNIQPGEAWPGAIINAIRQCEVMVLVFSTHSNESPQVLREIDRAVQRKLKIVTYRIDDTEPGGDLEYFLSTVQWLDASDTDPDDRMDFLVKSVEDLLSSGEGRTGQPPVPRRPVASSALPEPSKRRPVGFGGIRGLLFFGILIAMLAWATFQFLRDPSPESVIPPQSGQSGNGLAVLPFLNLTGTTELEWLRNGLPEMVITDLAQFRSFRVLSSQELHQAVAVDGTVPATLASTDELRRLGQAARASSILTGSFARSGELRSASRFRTRQPARFCWPGVKRAMRKTCSRSSTCCPAQFVAVLVSLVTVRLIRI